MSSLMLRQNGVAAAWQVGLRRQVLAERVKAGRLYRIHVGVYAPVPENLLTLHGRYMAAVLACGPGAALSHYSSLKLRGLMDSSRNCIDVTVPSRTGRGRPGIRIHRSGRLRRNDVELVHGIPCTTLARTIFDMAGELAPRRLERLLDEAAYQEVLDGRALDEQIAYNRPRARACARLTGVLTRHSVGSTRTETPIEEEMLALIRSTALPAPRIQYWIDFDDGEPMSRADFAWPEARLILETDGQRAHGKPKRTMTDYRRDQRAARAGWHTLRFAPQQIRNEAERVKQTLLAVVSSRLEQLARTDSQLRRVHRGEPDPGRRPAAAG
ncbi:MAG TPA: DUF559 domain-containing protein [Solirubrobacteraceae bacterium]|nr:DUF559 domain-containing protein [Solirubrobacteraceae bacterium]